jgi:hypothetical protein
VPTEIRRLFDKPANLADPELSKKRPSLFEQSKDNKSFVSRLRRYSNGTEKTKVVPVQILFEDVSFETIHQTRPINPSHVLRLM